VRGGLKAIYCSGWQVAGDANTAGDVYPDQSLYPANAVPELVRKLNKVHVVVVHTCGAVLSRCMHAAYALIHAALREDSCLTSRARTCTLLFADVHCSFHNTGAAPR